MKRSALIIAVTISIFGVLVILNKVNEPPREVKGAVTVHKTATCGCCANYASYLKAKGYDVTIEDHATNEDLTEKKRELAIPAVLDSCHTSVFATKEKYFVEGHIPLEAVEKMLANTPDIKGIGMPGMPSASPGMAGEKIEPFDISQVSRDGSVTNYMTL